MFYNEPKQQSRALTLPFKEQTVCARGCEIFLSGGCRLFFVSLIDAPPSFSISTFLDFSFQKKRKRKNYSWLEISRCLITRSTRDNKKKTDERKQRGEKLINERRLIFSVTIERYRGTVKWRIADWQRRRGEQGWKGNGALHGALTGADNDRAASRRLRWSAFGASALAFCLLYGHVAIGRDADGLIITKEPSSPRI